MAFNAAMHNHGVGREQIGLWRLEISQGNSLSCRDAKFIYSEVPDYEKTDDIKV